MVNGRLSGTDGYFGTVRDVKERLLYGLPLFHLKQAPPLFFWRVYYWVRFAFQFSDLSKVNRNNPFFDTDFMRIHTNRARRTGGLTGLDIKFAKMDRAFDDVIVDIAIG